MDLKTFGENLFFAGVAGITGATTVFPIDLVKTRLQSQTKEIVASGKSSVQYNGMMDCFKKTYQAGGVRAFYKGLLPNLVGITPEKAIKIAGNDYFRALFSRLYFGTKDWKEKGFKMPLVLEMAAGGCAGFCQLVATNPMEIVKIRMQMQDTLPKEVPRKSAVQVVQELGLTGLYRGSAATLLRDIPFSMIYFASFARLKQHFSDPQTGKPTFPNVLLSGIGAGVLASTLATPADVIKTRLQNSSANTYTGVLDCAVKIYKQEGPLAFSKGLIPRILIISPLFGITLTIYEIQQRWMQK